MTLERLAAVLGIDEWPASYHEEYERFCKDWEEGVRQLPVLEADAVESMAEEGFLHTESVSDILACAERIAADEELRFAFFAVYYALTMYRGPHQNEFYVDPCPPSLEQYRFTFSQAILVKLLIKGVSDARAKGIPEEYIAQHHGAASGDLVAQTGVYGTPGMFHWRCVCSFGTMYYCGAFRFEPERVPPGYRMVRRLADDKLLMLYTAPVAVDAYGQFARDEASTAFRTTASVGKLDGYMIATDGRILNRYVDLPSSEWALVFDGGDAALSFHIPPRIPYNADAAAASFKAAVNFYNTYYPEYAWKSIQSYSWLYSPQLSEMLAPTSGIVTMNSNLYLAPVPSGPDGFYEFVFQTDAEDFDPDTVLTDSSLKRGFVSFVKSGRLVHNGFMYLPYAYVDAFDASRAALYATDMYTE